ncbi:SCAPER domain-containing protein short spindle 3 [Arctopsyche grandis]|uniref:SCAPER domain-containing protein short spindle 3 n=1 Tax=Arctopsyche grandis TaxID=121162 RepID=UPI00406D9C21
MAWVQQRVRAEGRDARNLVAFHVQLQLPSTTTNTNNTNTNAPDDKISRKPPRPPFISTVMSDTHSSTSEAMKKQQPPNCARVRSASTGRDKRSELQARYWGLLFGNLQRAVGEIYSTVEAHESVSECQEAILVLENYTRDFKSLCEWFRLKWEYDNTPVPQRPLSLAWEIRKTSPAKATELKRNRSNKSSPSVSGKNSPCLSGKNSPCPSLGKISPSVSFHKISPSSSTGKVSPRTPVGCLSPKNKNDGAAFFSNKLDKLENIQHNSTVESQLDNDVISVNNIDNDYSEMVEIAPKSTEFQDFPTISQGMKPSFVNDNEKTAANLEDIIEDPCTKLEKAEELKSLPEVEIGRATEFPSLPAPQKAVVIRKNGSKNTTENSENKDVNHEAVSKLSVLSSNVIKKCKKEVKPELSAHAQHTTNILDNLENEYLKSMNTKSMSICNNETKKEDNVDVTSKTEDQTVNVDDIKPIDKDQNNQKASNTTQNDAPSDIAKESIKNIETKTALEKQKSDQSIAVSNVKPAYSQAASKPKILSLTKNVQDTKGNLSNKNINSVTVASKTPSTQYNRNITRQVISSNRMSRSKTIADIKQGPCRKAEIANKQISKQIVNNRNAGSYPFNLTVSRGKTDTICNKGTSQVNRDSIKLNKTPLNTQRPNTLSVKKDDIIKPFNSNLNKSIKTTYTKPISKIESRAPSKLLSTVFQSSDAMYSSSETIVNSRLELSHVESNESIKTLCADSDPSAYSDTFAGSVEVLNVTDDNDLIDTKGGNDGWLTVKSRRLGKNSQAKKFGSHWSNRYNQPSATASLPTLNMIESPKEGLSKIKDFSKLEISIDSAPVEKDKANTKDLKMKKPEVQKQKKEKKVEYSKKNNQQLNTQIIRQKSDVTGLKQKKYKENQKQSCDKNDLIRSDTNENNNKSNFEEAKNIKDKVYYTNKIKKFKKRLTKMHFSFEDLNATDIAIDSDITDITENKLNFLKNTIWLSHGKPKNTLHLSLDSLNSDSYTSVSLDFSMSKNDIFNASEISIDIDNMNPHSDKSSKGLITDHSTSKENINDNLDSDANEIEMMTNQIEENERKMDLALDWKSEEDQRKLSEEEELLNQQIQELQQNSDIDIDTETDDTETDGEVICEEDEDSIDDFVKYSSNKLHSKSKERHLLISGDITDDEMSLEDRYESILAKMSWVERMDILATLESLVARYPGRAQQLHAKLSHSMRRRGSLQETLKRYQAKQARAEQHRNALHKEKSNKLQQLLARVEDVKAAKLQLIEEKRLRMEQRMQKAKENRDQRLKDIVRKAHDEEEKLKEIAFIKQLEDQFKKDDFLAQCHEQTCRLIEVRADRMRRLEEKAAKEAAVEERKKALETERILKLDKLRESRKQREERIGRQQLQKEKERAQLAEEKARGRSERLSALQAAQAATAQELRRRILLKQRETARRHQQTISLIKQRALELSTQRPENSAAINENDSVSKQKGNREQKLQSDYNKINKTSHTPQSSDTSSMKHNESKEKTENNENYNNNLLVIKEKLKSQKRRMKKIKQRLTSKGQEYEENYEFPTTDAFSTKSKISRSINQISNIVQRHSTQSHNVNGKIESNKSKLIETQKNASVHSSLSDLSRNSSCKSDGFVSIGNGNVNQLDRFLGELTRIMEKQINPNEKLVWQKMNGFHILSEILSIAINEKENCSDITTKTLITVGNLFRMACHNCPQNCDYVLLSNKIVTPLDLLLQRLQVVSSTSTSCALATSLQKLISTTFRYSSSSVASRLQDIVSYLTGSGFVDLISQCCSSAEEPDAPGTCEFLESSLDLLATLTDKCAKYSQGESCAKLGSSLRNTEMCGSVRAVCCALAGAGPDTLDPPALRLALAALALMTSAAEADLTSYQEGLSGGTSLQFRHMVSRLLRHASKSTNSGSGTGNNYTTQADDGLLHALLPAIGYFALNNEENQNLLTSGSPPCVVQQLAALPLRYFSRAEHARMLLPALLACCTRSEPARNLLHQEVSQQLLEDFKNSDDGRKSRLVSLIMTQ